MFDEEKQTKTNVTIYHIAEYGVICTTILVSMHGNANSGKAYCRSKKIKKIKKISINIFLANCSNSKGSR